MAGYFYHKRKKWNEDEVILFVHGYGMIPENYGLEINGLVNRDYLVFAYDMTGCGKSEGKNTRGFSQFILDAHAAVNCLKNCGYADKIVIIGHSTGGYGVAALLNSNELEVKSVIVMSAFNYPPLYVKMCMQEKLKVMAYIMQFWTYIFESIHFGNVSTYTGIGGINVFPNSVLVIQGADDDVVLFNTSLYSMKKQIHNKKTEFVLVEHAKHFPTRKSIDGEIYANDQVFNAIEGFIQKDTIS